MMDRYLSEITSRRLSLEENKFFVCWTKREDSKKTDDGGEKVKKKVERRLMGYEIAESWVRRAKMTMGWKYYQTPNRVLHTEGRIAEKRGGG
jgi:hypothetical protein